MLSAINTLSVINTIDTPEGIDGANVLKCDFLMQTMFDEHN